MSYTLWLLPKEPEINNYLTSVVSDLAKKYDGPQFEPHLTLLGDQPQDLTKVQQNCEKITMQTKPFVVETSSVKYSTTYYQCLFIRIKPTPELMNLFDFTKQVFGLTNPSVYMPHISLFYGNIPYITRHEMMKSVMFMPQTFTVSSIVITPGGENPPSEWKHLAEVPFH